jgi:hypothetical protein
MLDVSNKALKLNVRYFRFRKNYNVDSPIIDIFLPSPYKFYAWNCKFAQQLLDFTIAVIKLTVAYLISKSYI